MIQARNERRDSVREWKGLKSRLAEVVGLVALTLYQITTQIYQVATTGICRKQRGIVVVLHRHNRNMTYVSHNLKLSNRHEHFISVPKTFHLLCRVCIGSNPNRL